MPNVALEVSTDDLADFVLAQPTSATTRFTYIANLRAFTGWAKGQATSMRAPQRPELRAAPEASRRGALPEVAR